MPGPSTKAKRKIVEALYEAHGPLCWLCKRTMTFEEQHPHPDCITIDHVVPLSLEGTWDGWNLRLAHNACNTIRGNSIDADEISERIGRMLRGERVFPRRTKATTPEAPAVGISGRKRQPTPKEEKDRWTFVVDGERVVGWTIFD